MTAIERPSVRGWLEPSAHVCSACGYGVVRPEPPSLCPMCGAGDAWTDWSRLPFGLGVRPER